MTMSTRFVPYALGAALVAIAAGTAAAEPPDSQDTPRAQAVARAQAPSAAPMQAAPAMHFAPEAPRAIERSFDRAPRGIDISPSPVRFSESAEAGDGQADALRALVPRGFAPPRVHPDLACLPRVLETGLPDSVE